MTNLKKWKTLKSQMVLNHQWSKVRLDEVELPSGEVINDYFVNVRDDIALILPVTEQREIVFVRQYRHAVGKVLVELPAGSFNPDKEDGVSAAARELEEETGYVAEEIVKLATLYDNPPKDTNSIHLFMAENVRQSGQQMLDITEEIEVILIPLEEVMERILTGEICVCSSIAALFLGLSLLST